MSRALGISVSSSFVKFVLTVVVVRSSTGASACTVTASCSVGDRQLHVDGQRLPDHDADVFLLHRLEAGQLEAHRIEAGRKRDQPIVAVFTGGRDLRLNQRRTGRGDGDARKDRAAVVGDDAIDAAAKFLRLGLLDLERPDDGRDE